MSAIPVPVGPLYGSLFIATIISVTLWGIACMQTFLYYIHYQDDPARLKLLVAAVWTLDTVHQSMILGGTYKYIMAGLQEPMSFITPIPELIWELLPATLVSVPTQAFFVYRVYIFSEKNILAPLIWLPLGISQIVSCIIYIVKGAKIIEITALDTPLFTDLSIVYSAVAAFVDVSIAVWMAYLLSRRRIATGFRGSAKILQRLTIFAINSGIWTAIFAVFTIILLVVYPSNMIYLVFDFPLCSVYSNMLLANLNARAYIKGNSTALDAGADVMMISRGPDSQYTSESGGSRIVFAQRPPKDMGTLTYSSAGRSTESTKAGPFGDM